MQKSRRKLPAWYEARCILPPRAYEQASSEAAAALKPYAGGTCLDLTAGLGVDSWHFGRHFRSVTALEADPDLAAVTAWNLRRLGCEAVQVHAVSAERFLASYHGPPFDLIYADPDRRTAGGARVHGLEDCSPDLPALLPRLCQLGKRLVFKLSPLFDLAEAARILPDLDRLAVLSVDGEVREVLAELAPGTAAGPPETAVWLHTPEGPRRFRIGPEAQPAAAPETQAAAYRYIAEPDAAFYKARGLASLLAGEYPGLAAVLNYPDGFAFCGEAPSGFPGRVFEVIEAVPYKPSALKALLRARGIRALNVVQRHFPEGAAAIRQQLGAAEGGELFLICTLWQGKRWAYLARRI
ncbi:MAG: SAM-dependent methyltransferase [Bacteroidia bacterium]|nr:SAM-dependent methyltransferase [Bacteroidia bacterium]